MNLKEQQYVCTLARCQTISKAAEELYISPSALSVYISNLEKYLGISLFLRTGRSFVLTPIGEEYVSRARKMLEMKDEFDCLVDHARRKAHPSIRIGIQQRRAISIAPELLKRFMEEYPDVEIIFRDGNQEELAAMYREGTVDFVVTMYRDELFHPQLGVKLCSMAGGGVQKIYMVLLREPSRRDRSGSDLFHLRDGFEIKMNFDRNVSCFIFVNAFMHDDFFD